MIRWIPCELHTHTIHSDGGWALEDLCMQAKRLGLEFIALTDHNTISGHREIPEVSAKTGIPIVHGLEWTTFYGHMVAMGVKDYLDWRFLSPEDIDEGISSIHKAGGLAGVAHPYRLGSPMCTGCHWQYEIGDWAKVDYLEVWTETFPSIDPVNETAMELWIQNLNNGIKCTAVSGKDWHGPENDHLPYAITYLGVDQDKSMDFAHMVLEAISMHHAAITLGPLMLFSVRQGNSEIQYGIGDTIKINKESTLEVLLSFDFNTRKGLWNLDSTEMKVVLFSNRGILSESTITTETASMTYSLQADDLTWIFPRLYGKMAGQEAEIAFTNPVFIE